MGFISRAASWIQEKVAPWQRKSNPNYAIEYSSRGGWTLPHRMPLNFRGYAKYGYRGNPTAFKCISYIARNGAGVEWGLYTDSTKEREITSHPLLDLWNNPNPEQYRFDFIEEWISFYLLSGNGIGYGISVSSNPTAPFDEIYMMRPDYVRIVPDEDGIKNYLLGDDRGNTQPVAPTSILHSKYWSPDDLLWGLSPLEIVSIYIDQLEIGNKWNLAFMQNAMHQPGFWKSDQVLNKIDFDRLKRDLKEKYAGYRNAGMAPLLDGGVTWQENSKPPLELDWINSSAKIGINIANVFNIDPALVGDTSASTFNNRKEAKLASYTEAIFPCLDKLQAGANRWLAPRYGKGLFLAYKKDSVESVQELIQAQQQAKSDRATKIYAGGQCTLNEAREMQGLPPDPQGDVYRIGAVLVPAKSLQEYAEQSLQKPVAPPALVPENILNQPTGQAVEGDPNDESVSDSNGGKSRAIFTARSLADYAAKALDLDTAEAKQAYAQSMESARTHWEVIITQRLQEYFEQERKAVVAAIDQAALPSTAQYRVEHVLNSQASQLQDVISQIYQDVGEDIGEQVAKSLVQGGKRRRKGRKGIIRNYIDQFGEDVLKYLLTIAGIKVQQISTTTLTALQLQLAEGVVRGESIPELAKRIDQLYLQQIIPNRSTVIAQTEVIAASNFGSQEAAKQSGLQLRKVWLATDDDRTRPNHVEADGQEVGLDEFFTVGGAQLMYPGDTSMGAPGEEIIQCRCTLFYRRIKADAGSKDNTKQDITKQRRIRRTYRAWMEAYTR